MTQYMRPSSDIASSGVVYSTGTSIYSLIDESVIDDNDYVYISNLNSYFTVGLETPVSTPDSNLEHTIHIRSKYSTGLPSSRVVTLLQNTTSIASFTLTPTTTYKDYVFTLTEAQIGNISDYSALRLKVSIGTSGFQYNLYISQAYLEIDTVSMFSLELGCAF